MEVIKCAIVGCGGIAQVHARALHELSGITPVVFADIRLERAQALAKLYGGNAYSSLEEMLEKEEFQVLHLCTPHVLHTPMASLAVARGIHVFSEKPPAISREQWEEFSRLQDVRVGICLQNRYNESVGWLKALVESGACGKVLGGRAIVTWSRNEAYYTESGWRGSLETEGGGVLMNQSVHTLDLLLQFMGRPTQVEATISNHHLKGVIEVEDTMEAYLEFEEGRSALFYATTAYCTDSPVLVELACEKGTFRMEEREITCRWSNGEIQHISFPEPKDAVGKAYWGSGHRACIEDFYRCLREGAPFRNDISGVGDTVETMLALYESARGRICVTL